MQLITDIPQWQSLRQSINPDASIGFVPTMGNLHSGHLSLIQKAKEQNTYCVVSIFVNPTQFDNEEDFIKYPDTLQTDLNQLETHLVDYCLLPSYKQLYPDDYNYQVHEKNLSKIMEGAHRQGHFNGVLTVVLKLLNLIKANRAYFGEKDYQQFQLIKNMSSAFFIDTKILAYPTIREASQLAYSSRITRLTPPQKKKAERFAQIFQEGHSCESIKTALEKENITLDYIEEYDNRRYIAVFIDSIRLIDNYPIPS